ncbi:MAG TPA: stage III sporulation protein AG [Clostridiaceae bacterium]|nr:stage III sporulation protein AG [Clostridiaceae bacterium]
MSSFKESILSKDKSKNKLIENSLIVLIIGAIILIAASSFYKDKVDMTKNNQNNFDNSVEVVSRNNLADYDSDMEKKLASILSKIDGVGKVDVMITYISGNEIVPAYEVKESENSSIEKDSEGGTREVTQYDRETKVVYEDNNNGDKKPVILKNIYPEIKGVVVVAEGADKPGIKGKLIKAVEVLTGVPVHRIQILERAK